MNAPVQAMEMPGMGTVYLVSGFDEARAVLTDPRMTRDDRNAPEWLREQAEHHVTVIGRNMLDTDPPEHTRLRGLIKKAFTPRRVEALRPRVEQITAELLDGMAGRSEVDLIEAIALPLPVTVICELLGLPMADRADFRRWTTQLAASMNPMADQEPARQGSKALRAYFEDLIATTKIEDVPEEQQPDLTKALLRAGDRLNREELVTMLVLLLVAGHETTVNLIGNAMTALMTHPEQFESLRSKPELVAPAVEELLRFTGPLQVAVPRFPTVDVEIAGVRIPAFSMVNVVVSEANRDASKFHEPAQLDITRGDVQHLAFGHGPHFCVGAALARLEGQVVINALLARFPEMRLAVPADQLQWQVNPMLKGLVALPVRLS